MDERHGTPQGEPLPPASAHETPPSAAAPGPVPPPPLEVTTPEPQFLSGAPGGTDELSGGPVLLLPDAQSSPAALDGPALAEAVTAAPAPPAPAPFAPAAEEVPPAPVPSLEQSDPGRGWGSVVWPATFFLLVILATIFFYPILLARWRTIEGRAEAEAAYARRRAELRAEAEAAVEMLDVLNKRVKLTSLGFREVVRKVTPNVVNVANYRDAHGEGAPKRGSLYTDPDNERPYRQTGVGSGILARPGYVLTNLHVVRGADRLRLTFASGQSLGLNAAGNVLADSVTDLAVIRLPADLPCALCEDVNVTTAFADSDREVHSGDLVLALGSPLGLKQTVTHGIISAKGRLLDRITLVELLQTDAPINPGNSGGPLFDLYGRVVGVNVAIASDNGGNQGIGFAIPSNTVKKVVDALIEKGEVPRGYIGVALSDLTRAHAKKLGLNKSGGVLVAQVVPEEAAARAGLRVGDVVVRYNKETLGAMNPMRHLRQRVVETEVGREVSVEVLRDGRRETLTLRIGKRPPDLP